jgi:hypothetical protein
MSLRLDKTDVGSRLSQNGSNVKVYVCPHCIHPFTVIESFENHLPNCAEA